MSAGETAALYAERGLGGRGGAGRRPALVIVDLSYGFTDPASPLHCPADEALAANAELLEAARAARLPVCFTTVAYPPGSEAVATAFLTKAPALRALVPGSRWVEIDERIAPRPGEWVLEKLFASAFFGTTLATWLAAERCDSVIVTGASTSGCVRATAVDALQHGYRVIVPREACADRAAGAHAASLVDLDAKYGDVVSLAEALDVLGRRATA